MAEFEYESAGVRVAGPGMDNKSKFRLASRAAVSMESSQLGFHNLPFLAHRKSVKRGFEFTLMVVGK